MSREESVKNVVQGVGPLKRPLPSPLVDVLTDETQLSEIIASIFDKSPEKVRSELREEESDLGKYHREAFKKSGLTPHVWDERLESFYRDTPAALPMPGHVVWNRRPEKLRMRQWIGEYLAREGEASLKVLSIGDGPGFDSLYLSQCGHDVTYFELSKECQAFARRVFELEDRPVHIVEDTDELADHSFDVVLCLDVLEHVPDPPEFVGQLAKYLRPGGRLIVHAPFFFVTFHNPTHLRASRKYSGDLKRLYTKNGLHLVDGCFFWNPLVLRTRDADGRIDRPRKFWPWLLRVSGCLLAVARFWSFPHDLIATSAMQKK